MTRLICACALLACTLQGCAVYAPANADALATRRILAAQTVPPQQRPDPGTDGAAAVSAYGNYQRSYATPVPQSEGATFGGGK